MEIVDYLITEKENPFIEDVDKLIVALNELMAENEAKGISNTRVTKSAVFMWKPEEYSKNKVLFARAANEANKTARHRLTEDVTGEDGTPMKRVTFTLTNKHKQRRNKDREHAAKEDGDNGTDAPFEDAPDNNTPPANSNDAAEATPESTPEPDSNDVTEEAAETVESTPTVSNRRRR